MAQTIESGRRNEVFERLSRMIEKPLEKSADIIDVSDKMIKNRTIARSLTDVADNLRLFKHHLKSFIDSECLLK